MIEMESGKLSLNGQKLIELYQVMAEDGISRSDGKFIKNAYNDFQLYKFRDIVLPYFQKHSVKTVLDYGCGGSDWEKEGFDDKSNKSALEFFSVETVSKYEPARDLDERKKSACVVCCDVLEHIFILDAPAVIRDICSYAERLVVLNVACYKAGALLPNKENAHITVRDPMWWKGMLDTISVEFPSLNILLLCSTGFNNYQIFESWNANEWANSDTFAIDLPLPILTGSAFQDQNEITVTKDQISILINEWVEQVPEDRLEAWVSFLSFAENR
jgi:hypothetical protein